MTLPGISNLILKGFSSTYFNGLLLQVGSLPKQFFIPTLGYFTSSDDRVDYSRSKTSLSPASLSYVKVASDENYRIAFLKVTYLHDLDLVAQPFHRKRFSSNLN